MQTYDIIMLIVLGAAALFGAWKGLAWQVASFASLFASYFVASQFRTQVAAQLTTSFQAPAPWNMFLAMLILFLGTSLAVWVGFAFIRGAIDKLKLKEFDRHVGALLGVVKGALLCVLITFFAMMLLGDREKKTIVNSYSGHIIAQALDKADALMPKEVHTVLGPYLHKLEDELAPGSNAAGHTYTPDLWRAGEKLAPNLGFDSQPTDGRNGNSATRVNGSRGGKFSRRGFSRRG